MAAPRREPNPGVNQPDLHNFLKEHPGAFDFFQAVRLIQLLRPEVSRAGGFAASGDEAVRFTVNNALAFPPSEIISLAWSEDNVEMAVSFMGLTGHAGVLPYCYTDLIQERQRAKDQTLSAFLDLFSSRFIALFYRAWEKYRLPIAFEHSRLREDGADGFATKLLSLVGLGTLGLQQRLPVNDHALVYFAGLLSPQPRSAAGLSQLLQDYFDIPVEIEQFIGCWRRLEPRDQCIFSDVDEISEKLGAGAIVGDEVWDQQSRARVRIGPLPVDRYREFLPNGKAHQPLRSLLNFYSNRELEFEIQLVLKRVEVPVCELGREGDSAVPLGWLTWMKSTPEFSRDPEDTVLLLT